MIIIMFKWTRSVVGEFYSSIVLHDMINFFTIS